MLGGLGGEYQQTSSERNSSPAGAGVRLNSFAAVPAANSMKWLVPSDNKRAALRGFQSYSPFAFRGRVLKQLLISATRLGLLPSVSTEVRITSDVPLELEELVKRVTGESAPAFCVTVGTATRFQKLTIQVLHRDGKPLAFIKLPMTAAAAGRIRHEALVLRELGETCMRDTVPRVLFDGSWGRDLHLLVLSPAPGRPSALRLQLPHERFLSQLAAVAPVTRPARTILDEVACEAEQTRLFEGIPALAGPALLRARREVGDQPARCGRIHGDFAPWNLRVFGQRLFSFDWESSETGAPLVWDALHFQAQVASLLKNGDLTWIRPYLESALDRALLLGYAVRSLCHAANEETPDAPMVEMRRQVLQALSA
jgi:hypothetical protein